MLEDSGDTEAARERYMLQLQLHPLRTKVVKEFGFQLGDEAIGDGSSLKNKECSPNKQLDRTNARSGKKARTEETELESVPKKRNRKPNSLMRPEEGYDPTWTSGERKYQTRDKKLGDFSQVAEFEEDILDMPYQDFQSPTEVNSESGSETVRNDSSFKRKLKGKHERGSRDNSLIAKHKKEKTSEVAYEEVKKENRVSSDPEEKQKHAQQIDGTSPGEKDVEESNDKDVKGYGEELVGHKIKIWWPLDQRFYEGVVGSFDPTSKMHKVLYDEGDEETLDLEEERWELVERNIVPEKKEQETNASSSDALSDMPEMNNVKTKSDSNDKIVSSSATGSLVQDENQLSEAVGSKGTSHRVIWIPLPL